MKTINQNQEDLIDDELDVWIFGYGEIKLIKSLKKMIWEKKMI